MTDIKATLTAQDRDQLVWAMRSPAMPVTQMVETIIGRHEVAAVQADRSVLADRIHELALLHFLADRDGACGLTRAQVADLLIDLEGQIRAGGPR